MVSTLYRIPGYLKTLSFLKRVFGGIIKMGPVPKHIGIIMDGSRRYARAHKLETKEGHNLGFASLADILELLYESGVDCATVFAFSIENFNRLPTEVDWLMDLAKVRLREVVRQGDLCEKYGVRIKILGNVSLFPDDVRELIRETEEVTEKNDRATLNICFLYTSRDEIAHGIRSTVEDYNEAEAPVFDEKVIEEHLYTSESPPLDILIRTSGTFRLSDFLLWQCVSSSCSVVFVDTLWPEFGPWSMVKILLDWSFNRYWHGARNYSSSGQTVAYEHSSDTLTPDTITSVSPEQNKSTSYERYPTDGSTTDAEEFLEDDDSSNADKYDTDSPLLGHSN